MSKDNKIIGMAVVAACLASAWASAQPAMPGFAAPAPGAGALPVTQPAMPTQATPQAAPPAAPASGGAVEIGNNQRNILRMISEKKAELDLLKLQAEIDKFKKPQEDAPKRDDVPKIATALEQAKKEQAQAPAMVDQGPTVTLLATYGMPEVPGSSFAELKVGDLLVNAKVGDRLPSGHYVTAIHFDSVELSKNAKAKKGSMLFISATDTASVYASRPKSGQAAAAGESAAAAKTAAVPMNLPPMPTR